VQVAAEKAKWPIREEFKRMSSREGGGSGAQPRSAETLIRAPPRASDVRPSPPAAPASQPAAAPAASGPPRTSQAETPAKSQHGVTRYSSVLGTRRR
jgi:hypothetical protein